MKRSQRLEILLRSLISIQKLMKKSGCPWAIIGGVAASILGKPRFTADVDVLALVEDDDIARMLRVSRQYGFKERIKNAVGFAKKNRVLLLAHKGSGINVDISLGFLPFEKEAIKNSKRYRIGGLTFYLPTPEDLIVFKAVAHRPVDLIDIQEIVNSNPKIDRLYIKKKVKEFASFLEMPEVWKDIEDIVAGHRRRRGA
ncbi:MAG: nucleotidyltransferase [Candidatus Omnitrophica bacterium]|nr:nucleotidyltransferase [Candidatus Omnitrophota bacterium]